MKLDAKQFKRFKELSAKAKAGKISSAEEAELSELTAMKNQKGSNDLEWWKNYPTLTRDVTNLPFNWIPGRTLKLTNGNPDMVDSPIGVIAIAQYLPSIGHSVSDADAFNSQIRQLWLDLHRKYRGIGKYEKSDLGMMILAINAFFTTLAKLERMYGVINTYHIGNRVVPNGLMSALHIGKSLLENLADFRYTLNLYIAKAKQLCLPKGLSILSAEVTAAANLFKDSEDRRAFIFGFDPSVFGYFDVEFGDPDGTPQVGSCVKYKSYSSYQNDDTPDFNFQGMGLADVQQLLEFQISQLLNNEDVAIMCSDLLAAYGPENVMTLVELPEDYKVEPIHDYERLLQFHNLTIHGGCSTIFEAADNITVANAEYERTQGNKLVVYQYDNVIKNRIGKGERAYASVSDGTIAPTFNVSELDFGSKLGEVIFDTWVAEPGETEVMCGTRYTNIASTAQLVSTNTYRQEIDVMGTGVVERIAVFYYNGVGYAENQFRGSTLPDNTFRSHIPDICRISQMDWRPTFYHLDDDDVNVFGDLDNFTLIDRSNLGRIHEVALLSGYKIPMVTIDSK